MTMSSAERPFEIHEPGSWSIDAAHFPTPITPYHAAILKAEFPRGFAEGSRRVGLLLSHFDHEVVNGFDYMAPRPVGAPKTAKRPPPYPVFKLLTWLHPEIRRRLKTAADVIEKKPWREDLRVWETEVRPASTKKHLALQAVDPASLDDGALAEHMEELCANARHQYYLHHRFTVTAMLPVGDLIAHVKEWTGLSSGVLLQAVRQPHGIATDAREQFDAAVAALRGDKDARATLEANEPAARILDELSALGGAPGNAVRAWLRMTGHRLVTGYDICDLTGLEMPELLVRTLRASLGADDRKRVEETRKEHAARVRDAVPEKHRAEYDTLFAEATAISNLREERALVLDFWAYGLVRRAVKEAGSRLVAHGRIDAADHLFDASHEEMLALVRGSGGLGAAALADRHAWRTTATADVAPKQLGFPPSPPPPEDWLPPAARRMSRAVDAVVEALFAEPEPRREDNSVHGLNASAGVYEGRARVVTRVDDFERICTGDVLVARMTTEAYNGIIALIGAVVTDRGGLLSHAATVAREFGIPAVVGTGLATKVIPDAARVRVDGDRGEARIV